MPGNNSRACIVRSSSLRNDFCCVSFLNRGPKEDGGRKAKAFANGGQMIWCVAGFLPSPLLMAAPRTVKSFSENSSGTNTNETKSSAGTRRTSMSLLQFITAVPLNVQRGSGCYVGTRTLVKALRQLGIDVALTTPQIVTPVYTATRLLFNETLRWRHFGGDATVGIDADGYAIADRSAARPHIACIKGVLGDAVRFERGMTRASMAFQARLEAKHARRADQVITVSQYCAGRLEELYRDKQRGSRAGID